MKLKSKTILVMTTLVGVLVAVIAAGNLPKKGIPESQEKRLSKSDHDPNEAKEDPNHKIIKLSQSVIKEEGITISSASPGKLRVTADLPGQVVINADRMAHIVPRMGGIVIDVRKKAGDQVEAGEVMAVMESRELADAKAKYLAAMKRLDLATSNFKRFEMLWEKVAIPEKQYIEIKTARDEAEIEKDSAEQRLRALGFTEKFLRKLPSEPTDSLSRYEITSPFQGTVIQKHITLGEMLKDDTNAFVVADLSTVWVNVQVYPKDLPNVRSGQKVVISVGNGTPDFQGTVEYVEPVVGDNTRSAIARVVLHNPDGKLRPGLFVSAKVSIEDVDVSVLVPKTALKNVDNKSVTFVRENEGFEPRIVKTGRTDGEHVEIVSGLQPGERFASGGSFLLKAELGKSDVADDH
ncbi:MAG: efflux RND transporter periplasmic adaptor subunit [Deltaproteobacteria bacterium]|nr:efflux RND transporter periplasmic adaptor subunit [Deltaproteobacteria bacterium]